MRCTGVYTTYAGEERMVFAWKDESVLQLLRRDDPRKLGEEVDAGEVGDVVGVRVRATWRGGSVLVDRMRGEDEVVFLTESSDLAAREGLRGDQHRGWGGVARIEELTDVVEDVRVLKEAGAP